MSVSSQSVDSLLSKAKSRGEPSWLVELRREAWARYEALEAPQWRRTDLAGLDLAGAAWRALARPALTKRTFAKAPGVVHLPLVEAAREHPDLVQPLVRLSPRADKWEALQVALWSEGSLLFVEKGTEVAEPIEASDPYASEGGVVRDLVAMRPRSKANLLLRTQGAAKGAIILAGTEIEVEDGANLTLSTIQDLHHEATLLSWRRATLRRDAKLAWVDGQFGGGKSVSVNENLLEGAGAELRFIGAFFGSAKQHMDGTTAALHAAPHTSSQLDMKGALNDDGYSANYSIVFIGPAAKNASGHQHQETLVLSEGARADAIPKLDVENNEVSASHGATVGQVDPEQLFYLRSRGFSEIAAKRLIVEGFFDPLLEKIPIENVREEVRAAIVGRLKG